MKNSNIIYFYLLILFFYPEHFLTYPSSQFLNNSIIKSGGKSKTAYYSATNIIGAT